MCDYYSKLCLSSRAPSEESAITWESSPSPLAHKGDKSKDEDLYVLLLLLVSKGYLYISWAVLSLLNAFLPPSVKAIHRKAYRTICLALD